MPRTLEQEQAAIRRAEQGRARHVVYAPTGFGSIKLGANAKTFGMSMGRCRSSGVSKTAKPATWPSCWNLRLRGVLANIPWMAIVAMFVSSLSLYAPGDSGGDHRGESHPEDRSSASGRGPRAQAAVPDPLANGLADSHGDLGTHLHNLPSRPIAQSIEPPWRWMVVTGIASLDRGADRVVAA